MNTRREILKVVAASVAAACVPSAGSVAETPTPPAAAHGKMLYLEVTESTSLWGGKWGQCALEHYEDGTVRLVKCPRRT